MADSVMTLAQIEQAMAERFRLHPAKAQFTRSADSAKWFRPRGVKMNTKRWHFYVYTEPATSVRGVAYATGVAGTFPAAQQLTYLQMSWDNDDLTMFQGSGDINVEADLVTKETETQGDMVYRLATKVIGEIILDFDEKLNQSVHMNTSATMATVKAVYDEDGTSYTSGQTDAYLSIAGGQIAMFHKGMDLYIGATETVVVKDVIHGSSGPWSGGSRVASIGPGIVVEWVSGGSNLDGVTAADAIARSGETAGSNFAGFPAWFSGTTNVYNDEDGSAIDRDGIGYAWSIPEIFTIAAAGSEVALDLDDHFRQVADVLPRRVKTGRNRRKKDSPEAAVNAPKALVLITTNELTNEATQTIADTQRFATESAMSMNAAKRKALFGDVGFEGTVWHSATLGPIAIQADATARPFKMDLIDPSSWFMLYQGGKDKNTLQWVPNPGGGSRWHAIQDSKSLTLQQRCGAYVSCLLACDQPGANAEISGVKSSLY